jgi:hypothetical protein
LGYPLILNNSGSSIKILSKNDLDNKNNEINKLITFFDKLDAVNA